jgi:hypothetical protein
MGLPDGAFLLSTIRKLPAEHVYTATIKPVPQRQEQWREIVSARLDGRPCRVFMPGPFLRFDENQRREHRPMNAGRGLSCPKISGDIPRAVRYPAEQNDHTDLVRDLGIHSGLAVSRTRDGRTGTPVSASTPSSVWRRKRGMRTHRCVRGSTPRRRQKSTRGRRPGGH